MAKIINDSLLPSAPNAPLDARTEVNLLTDVAKIENPSESLIFKVKETGKYYKVVSLKEVSIEGTTLKKKVIKEYAPFSDLQDAPKDGYKYVRMNGVWVRHEVDLDPTLPILTVNIRSNQGVDPIIDSLKCVAKYGSNEIELSSGEQINIPYGVNLTIEFPEVDEYNNPENITVEDVASNMTFKVEYTTEKVIINVSAEDGSEVDGQAVTVVEGIFNLDEYGVAIMDINGKFYKDAAAWRDAGSPTPNGIAISDGIHRLCIAKDVVEHSASTNSDIDKEYWGANGIIVNGVTTSTDKSIALKDFNGIGNTDSIVANVTSSDGYFTKEPWSAAALCRKFTFPNGRNGYLGAVGEWNLVQGLIDSINSLMSAIGGTQISVSGSSSSLYWTSTQANETSAWRWQFSSKDASTLTKENTLRVRAFSTIGNTKIHDVTGGKVEFKLEYGKSYNVSINSKEGDYLHPEAVTFTAGQQQRVINFKYIPLLIDTIYINNSIADSDAIVTGEMNGLAVQAIWNEGKRHLGKYVTKEDGTKEMVLIKVDDNDSRYFEDGTPIDVEGLGNKAFYFSKIAAMSYKITEMSDNIYKIQICYKYQPDKSWKFFDEIWVPVFFNVGDSRGNRPYWGSLSTSSDEENPGDANFGMMEILDYSNLMLLLFAKYGNNGYKTDVTEGGQALVNGATLNLGNKDVYRHVIGKHTITGTNPSIETIDNYFLNILGLENVFFDCYYYGSLSKWCPMGLHGTKVYGSYKSEDYTFTFVAKNPDEQKTISIPVSTSYCVKSRFISSYFCLLPISTTNVTGTYYDALIKKNPDSRYDPGSIYLSYMTGFAYNLDRFYSRSKYTGAYRIETDREKFNELTNTWV